MADTTVRISEETRATLRALAKEEGKPMQAVLAEAVEALSRRRFLQRVNDAYAALRGDPAAAAAIDAERHDWEASLMDGLVVREPAARRPATPKTRKRR